MFACLSYLLPAAANFQQVRTALQDALYPGNDIPGFRKLIKKKKGLKVDPDWDRSEHPGLVRADFQDRLPDKLRGQKKNK